MTTRKSLLRKFIIILSLPILLTSIVWSQQPSSSTQPAQSSAFAVPTLPADIPSNAERYSFLLMGNLAGQQAISTTPDGTLHIFFQFNDCGRGAKTTSVVNWSRWHPGFGGHHRQRLPEISRH